MQPVARLLIVLVGATVSVLAPLFAAPTADPHPGQAPYDRVCKVCHGEQGQGNAAPRLVPFTMDADELLIRVREGGGEMPPISANRVSDDEINEIAAYLKSLTPADDPRP